jgi:hypothetical protein
MIRIRRVKLDLAPEIPVDEPVETPVKASREKRKK